MRLRWRTKTEKSTVEETVTKLPGLTVVYTPQSPPSRPAASSSTS